MSTTPKDATASGLAASGAAIPNAMPAKSATAPSMAQLNSWLVSGNLENWQKVAQSPTATYRQIHHIAKLLADRDIADDRFEVAKCAKNLLSHHTADTQVAKLLLDSRNPLVWLEVLDSHFVDEPIVEQIHLKNESDFSKMNRMAEHEKTSEWKLMLRVREVLSGLKAINAETLDGLARTDGTKHWLKVAASEKTSRETLWYIVHRLQVEPDHYNDLDELLKILLCRNDLGDELKQATLEIQEYAQLAQTTQDQELSEADLTHIAQRVAATSIHPRQVCDAALGLSWHNNATPQVMAELARSTQSVAMFCVAQAELTDAQTLDVIARNVHLMRYRNPWVYSATVKELIRHPNLTDAVVRTLVNNTANALWVCSSAALALCAERDTLRLIVDRIYDAIRNDDSSQIFPDWCDAMQNVLSHPHVDRTIRSYIITRTRKSETHLEATLQSILKSNDEGYIWGGYRLASSLPRMDWVVNITAWWALTSHFAGRKIGILYPVWLKEILQSEYLTADSLDKIVQIFTFQTDKVWWNNDLKTDYKRGYAAEVLQMLYGSPYLTDHSREVLLDMKGVVGDELRRIAKSNQK